MHRRRVERGAWSASAAARGGGQERTGPGPRRCTRLLHPGLLTSPSPRARGHARAPRAAARPVEPGPRPAAPAVPFMRRGRMARSAVTSPADKDTDARARSLLFGQRFFSLEGALVRRGEGAGAGGIRRRSPGAQGAISPQFLELSAPHAPHRAPDGRQLLRPTTARPNRHAHTSAGAAEGGSEGGAGLNRAPYRKRSVGTAPVLPPDSPSGRGRWEEPRQLLTRIVNRQLAIAWHRKGGEEGTAAGGRAGRGPPEGTFKTERSP